MSGNDRRASSGPTIAPRLSIVRLWGARSRPAPLTWVISVADWLWVPEVDRRHPNPLIPQPMNRPGAAVLMNHDHGALAAVFGAPATHHRPGTLPGSSVTQLDHCPVLVLGSVVWLHRAQLGHGCHRGTSYSDVPPDRWSPQRAIHMPGG